MINFFGPKALFDDASAFYPLIQFAATRAGYRGVERRPGGNESLRIDDIKLVQEKFTLPTLNSWLIAGGEIYGLPFFFQMSQTTYDGDVKDGIDNRLTEGGSVRKWNEWKDASHQHRQLSDNTWVVPGNSWGMELPASQVKLLFIDTDYTVLTRAQYKAILAAEPE